MSCAVLRCCALTHWPPHPISLANCCAAAAAAAAAPSAVPGHTQIRFSDTGSTGYPGGRFDTRHLSPFETRIQAPSGSSQPILSHCSPSLEVRARTCALPKAGVLATVVPGALESRPPITFRMTVADLNCSMLCTILERLIQLFKYCMYYSIGGSTHMNSLFLEIGRAHV